MSGWGSFTNNWAAALLNPVGAIAQHVSVDSASEDYRNGNPPGQGFDIKTITEEGFKVKRQQWIDACQSSLKARDVGYSKANAAGACQGSFDKDPITAQVQDTLFARAAKEKETLAIDTQENTKKVIGLAFIFLIVAVALYLLLKSLNQTSI